MRAAFVLGFTVGLALAGAGAVQAAGLPTAPGKSQTSLTVAGTARRVVVYLPAKRAPHPALLLAFHGTSGDPDDLFGATDLADLAEQNGFIVLAPAARQRGENEGDWDNHSGNDRYWETFPNLDPGRNPDLALVNALLDGAARAYAVDPGRVYALGFSNGGFFTVFAAMLLRDRIAAFATSEAGLVTCERTGSCTYPFTVDESGASRLGRAPPGECRALLAAAPASCRCAGAEKPAPVPTAGRIPPGLVSHNAYDDAVSAVYGCALAARITALGGQAQVELWSDRSAGHAIQPGFAGKAWSFFTAHPLAK
jgi:poly(3-hydroxybutyrate) depolymerase